MRYEEHLDVPGLDLVDADHGWTAVVLRNEHGDVVATPAVFKLQDGRYRLALPSANAEFFHVGADGRIEIEL